MLNIVLHSEIYQNPHIVHYSASFGHHVKKWDPEGGGVVQHH